MSPVIRKWGMRGVAALCIGAFSLAGTVLYVGAFGGVDGTAVPIAQAELPGGSWWDVLDRYGLPIVILGVVGYYGKKGFVAVWQEVKPLIKDEFAERKRTIQKQGAFAENANSLLQKSVLADETNGQIIHQTHGLVKEIHGATVTRNLK